MKKSSLFVMLGVSMLLTGCGPAPYVPGEFVEVKLPDFPATESNEDSWNLDNEDFEFTWFVNDSTFTWSSYGSDEVSQIIKEKTGATIHFISPVIDDNAQLSNMIANNKLPDVISVQCWYQQCAQLAMQGYLYPLNDLIDRWAPSLKNRLQDDVFSWFSLGNDKTYGFPNFAYSNKYVSSDEKMEPNGGILVREDWYKEACAHIDDDMTSPESFIAGCNYIKSKYSNSIPVQLDVFDSEGNDSVKWLSQYFATPFEDEQGNYVYNMTHEKYYETLSFLNECYNNKLIMDENFSMNASQIRTKIASGNVFVSMVTPQDYQQGFIASYNSDIKYVPLILRNYEGDDPILQDIRGMGYLYTMVTTNAKRPDKIIKLLDFLYSEEGQRLVAFGLEGETWNWVDDKHTEIKWTDTYLNSVNNDDTGKYGLYQMTLMMNLAYINKIKPLNGRKDVDIYIDNLKKPISPYSYDYTASFLKDDTSDKSYNEVSVNETKGVQRWSSSYLAKVLRSSNKEQAKQYYDQGISYMKKNCMLEKVIEFNSQSYKRAKEALKLTYAWPKNMENYVSPKTGPNGDFSYWKGATHE